MTPTIPRNSPAFAPIINRRNLDQLSTRPLFTTPSIEDLERLEARRHHFELLDQLQRQNAKSHQNGSIHRGFTVQRSFTLDAPDSPFESYSSLNAKVPDLKIDVRETIGSNKNSSSSPALGVGLGAAEGVLSVQFESRSPSKKKQIEKLRKQHDQLKIFTEGYERVITLKTAENMAVTVDKRPSKSKIDQPREQQRLPVNVVLQSTELSDRVLRRMITGDTLDTDSASTVRLEDIAEGTR